ncbi:MULTISPECIES: hypothetical protein [unclassified Paraburkholderia]|uniref:hypothetical protein n=1 Tax=unclassified Paraburkholderia TaxID=2615204 RepID=UPI0020B6E341|nr:MULTISPECIES: hypothetical protein [unclassified Paraburkholderia]MCP3716160.1 hypothetical protein [Paraburkholderia sp. CNPSo 3281]MCX5544239.1 hypothetical protein [Paraburkholderia sp. CNPSo 3076]
MSGHDERSTNGDRFDNRRFRGDGERNRTGFHAVDVRNSRDLGDLRHRSNIHETVNLRGKNLLSAICNARSSGARNKKGHA